MRLKFKSKKRPVITTAGNLWVISPLLELELRDDRPTIGFVLQNGSSEYANVTINFYNEENDTLVTTTVTLSPEEIIQFVTPTANCNKVALVASEKCFLVELNYEPYKDETPGFYPYEIVLSSGAKRGFSDSYELITGATLHVKFTQPAERYYVLVNTNRPVNIVKGRVKHYVLGSVLLQLTTKQELYITAESRTVVRLGLTASKGGFVETNYDFTMEV